MTPRAVLALLIGLGLAMIVFLIMALVLFAARGEDFLSGQAMALVAIGSVLVVARPAWGIAGRVVSPRE